MFPKSEWGMFPKRMLHVPAPGVHCGFLMHVPDTGMRHPSQSVRQALALPPFKPRELRRGGGDDWRDLPILTERPAFPPNGASILKIC